MKKSKITLSGLTVESFVTQTSYVRGGMPGSSHGATVCTTEDITCEGSGCLETKPVY